MSTSTTKPNASRPAVAHAARPAEATTPAGQDAAPFSQETFSAFSEVLGHRLGNLLASIEGHTDLLLPVLDRTEDRENAFRILESVSRMNGILKDLRHYEEALEIRAHMLEADRLTRSLTPLLADSEAARLRLESNLDERILVRADERLIRQALLSVLRNAFEATRSDALAVSLRADCIEDGTTIRFRIHSAAPLEDETIRRRLFEPFFTTKAANLGLGLTMARRIFRAHGGDVKLTSSALESGTEFSCVLPRVLA